MNKIWKCICGEEFNSRRLLQKHRKKCKKAQKIKQNHYFLCNCQYCNRKFTTKEGKTVHEKHCPKNINRVPGRSRKHTKKEKEHLSKVMKKVVKKCWKNREYRAILSATQYISKHKDKHYFTLYYSINSKNKVKIGLSTDYKLRSHMYNKSKNVSDGEYFSIRNFRNVKYAALCEALVTINFNGNSEWYDIDLLNKIINFVKTIDISKELKSDFAKKIL